MTYITLKKQYLGFNQLTNLTHTEKLLWDTTTPIEVLQGMFKCSIECYYYDKRLYEDVYETDCPYGELHFIGLNNNIYNSDFEIVSHKQFYEKYEVTKVELMKLISNQWEWVDIPRLSNETDGYCFIKFSKNQLIHYTINSNEDIQLLS